MKLLIGLLVVSLGYTVPAHGFDGYAEGNAVSVRSSPTGYSEVEEPTGLSIVQLANLAAEVDRHLCDQGVLTSINQHGPLEYAALMTLCSVYHQGMRDAQSAVSIRNATKE